ncbi:hypothetical protein [Pseudocitrobacter faecalis]|uniref:hypothetical protein n=1 Tax=Pseudocitrobacter faecalis TaxID=1398493 RepID=UPI004063EE49
MNLRHTVFIVVLMTLSPATQASTMDEIKSLWHPQGARASGSLPSSPEGPEARHFRRSSRSGTASATAARVNLADWKVVLFMQDTARTATSLIRS